MLHALENFIFQNTPTGATFVSSSMARTGESLYPRLAIREGLVNALVHRDYSSFSGSVSVFVYPKRLEIVNSGGFPEGVTPAEMTKGHVSVLRNPDIAHVLYLRGLMEKLGRGGVLIQRECKNQGLPPPEWKEDSGKNVILTFRTPEVTPEVAPEATPEVKKMLSVMDGEMSRKEIQEKLGLSDEKHFREFYQQVAISIGLIEMTIPDKPKSSLQKYRLTEKGRRTLSRERG